MNVLDRVVENLQDPDPGEREWALDRLGALSPPNARALAVPLLSDPVVGVRESAATCLGTIRDEEAVTDLIRVARGDPSAEVRTHALMSLSNYENEEVRRCLLDVLQLADASNLMRMKAAFQLWKYDDDEVVRELRRAMLDDEDQNVRLYAADSLYFLFGVRGRPPAWRGDWEAAADDECVGVQRFAERALRAP